MTITRSRYQEGSIARVKRSGDDVWVYRWREALPDGTRVQRKRTVGTIKRYPTKAAAKKAVESLRSEVNADLAIAGVMTVEQAWGHFQKHELHASDRSPTTIMNYVSQFKAHIIPKWGTTPLDQVKAVAVEAWLKSLPGAPATKMKIKAVMSALYSHCVRHELCDKNPISSVRASTKRLRTPDVLTMDEIICVLAEIDKPAIRVAAVVAAATGLRRSEIQGLKWEDVDFDKAWLTPKRGRVHKMETRLKTEASRAGIPIPLGLVTVLRQWRESCLYRANTDWIFASEKLSGRAPLWLSAALRRILRPAVRRAGINKVVGWHTFRRSLATALAAKGADIKTVQELMRHANSRITLDVYAQGNVDAKRAAQELVSGLFALPGEK